MKKTISSLKMTAVYSFWNAVNRIVFFSSRCCVGRQIRTRGRVRVLNRGLIEIGNNVTINSSIMSNPLGGNVCTILVALSGAKIRVGKKSGLSNCTLFAREAIDVGENVMIGAGTKIYDNDFHSANFEDRIRNELPVSKPVSIEDGVFIGAHSIILKGVTIGKYSVIGAGSVVTKSIPEGEIWAGNPARFIRKVDAYEGISSKCNGQI